MKTNVGLLKSFYFTFILSLFCNSWVNICKIEVNADTKSFALSIARNTVHTLRASILKAFYNLFVSRAPTPYQYRNCLRNRST